LPNCEIRLKALKPKPLGYPEHPRSFGERLRRARLDRGLRVVDVARELGVNEWTVINWEQGRTEPRLACRPAVIAFLGVDPWPAETTLGGRLRAARHRLGLSQRQVAAALEIDDGTVRNIEHGRRTASGRVPTAVQRTLVAA
jgi:transcriptional regulator with XRE-family HTH domain